MDIDTESIIKLIAPNGIQESWKDNPDFYSYLAKLGNYSVEQLSKEPDHLNAEKVGILNQTQELAFANYKTFIRTAECSREIFQQFNKTEESVESLLGELPELSRKCSELARTGEEIRRRRRANTTALTRHSSVLQVLEVPQLMETLVREEMYEEALQLAAYVRHLGKTHPNLPIINNIVAEVEKCWTALGAKLVGGLSKLSGGLPQCLQLAGHLRRMALLTDQELKLKFLQARDSWLKSALSTIPTQDRSLHLSKLIELSRTHLFNIITQYKAVFTEDEASFHSVRPKFNEILLLHSWINEKVEDLSKTIEEDIRSGGGWVVGGLGPASCLGQSLGRVGCDPRGPALSPPFIKAAAKQLEEALHQAEYEFSQAMSKFSPSPLPTSSQSPIILEHERQSQGPPERMIQFYPLCVLHNRIASALNQLRLFAPLCLADKSTNLLQSTLHSASSDILHFYRREQGAMNNDEREWLTKMCCCFRDDLVPYLQKCLHLVYPPLEIASFLGVPPLALQAQGLTYFDTKVILTPIEHLLPPRLTDLPTASLPVSSSSPQLDKEQPQTD